MAPFVLFDFGCVDEVTLQESKRKVGLASVSVFVAEMPVEVLTWVA